jgi:hypothetical protein
MWLEDFGSDPLALHKEHNCIEVDESNSSKQREHLKV